MTDLLLFKVSYETTVGELDHIADTLEGLDELEDYRIIVASDMEPVNEEQFRQMLEGMLENLDQ